MGDKFVGDISSPSKGDDGVCDTNELLRHERQKNAILQEEIQRLRAQSAKAVCIVLLMLEDIQCITVLVQLAEAEVEAEAQSNRLMRTLNKLKKEKEELAIQIDREEEFISNTLQRKLAAVQREKAAMENQLEAEQEYLVNRLQKQVVQVMKDKA